MRAFRIAYDGRPFHGFQRQPQVPTVEDALFDALRALDVLDSGVPEGYAGAGRTDAGVSALAQTVAFQCPSWLKPAAFNSELPADVRAWASADVPDEFHATHDAREREYTYHLHAPDGSLERAEMAVEGLSGEHDFHNFTPEKTGTTRTLTSRVDRDGEWFVLTFRAGGFPRAFVRRAVTVIASVARGDADRQRIGRLLAPEPVEGPEGVPSAPPEPLVLTNVEYEGVAFEGDKRAIQAARDIFDARALEHKSRARVASAIAEGIDQ